MELLTKSVWMTGLRIFSSEKTKNAANTLCLGEAFCELWRKKTRPDTEQDFVNSSNNIRLAERETDFENTAQEGIFALCRSSFLCDNIHKVTAENSKY